MAAVDVSREQVIAYRVAAQGLHRTGQTDLDVLDIGVQDSGADAARLAFAARLPEPPPPDGIGPGQSLALVWSLRGAPHVHRRIDLDGLAGALWPLSEADAVARLDSAAKARKAGVASLDAYSLAVDALRTAVTEPMGKGAASAAVTALMPEPLTRYCRGCQATHVFELPFRMGALPAGLELEPGTSPPVLVPRAGARLADGPDIAALRQLIVGYLTMLGPATQADVAGYLEARRADVAAVWPDGLAEVNVDGKPAFLPADRVKALRKPPEPDVVRLLGAFDPFLQARDRDLIVPDRAIHKALWPILGRPGVLLVDGEVMGTWRPRAAGKKLTLTVEQFAPLPPSVWSRVEAEAQIVGQVRGSGSVTVTRAG
jgi:Winged helix DNA-binding domain